MKPTGEIRHNLFIHTLQLLAPEDFLLEACDSVIPSPPCTDEKHPRIWAVLRGRLSGEMNKVFAVCSLHRTPKTTGHRLLRMVGG